MRQEKRFFLAYPIAHWAGLRHRLEELAARGWELESCDGWLTGRFVPTHRTELRYDVVPARPFRTAGEAQAQVRRRRSAGWQAVDTLWGLDIYKSLPCQFRSRDTAEAWPALSQRLMGEGALTLLTLLLLFLCRGRWGEVLWRWYLSDGKTGALILLPVIALSVLASLTGLGLSLGRGSSAGTGAAMVLGAGLRLAGVIAAFLLAVTLWVQQVPRLWLRLALMALFLLAFPLGRRLGAVLRAGRLMLTAGLLCALLLLTTLLGWTVPNPGYDIGPAAHAPLIAGADVGQEGRCSGWYEHQESLLVGTSTLVQQWESGDRLELTVCRCAFPVTELVWRELEGDWHRRGNLLVSLSGDFTMEEAELFALAEQIP